jgi:hypothetical protein
MLGGKRVMLGNQQVMLGNLETRMNGGLETRRIGRLKGWSKEGMKENVVPNLFPPIFMV